MDLIQSWGAKISHAKKQKKYCNKFNKDFKNGLYNFSKLYLTYDIHIWYILQ